MLLDHTIFMVSQATINDTPPRSNDQFGPVHTLEEAIRLEKDIHVFLASGTGLILEGSSGYTYQMQRALDLIAFKSLGTDKSSPFKRVVFIQPTTPNTTMASNTRL